MKTRCFFWILWLAIAIVLSCVGYSLLITFFALYDDEGYVLWSVRKFCEGQPIYTEVFSQYGPFFYIFYKAIQFITGLVFDNDTARFLTLFYWVVTSLLLGGLARRITGSLIAGTTTAGLTFSSLLLMFREPFHPGGLLSVLTALGVTAGASAILRSKPKNFALWTGLAAGIMLLIKINVGAFFLIAASSWIIANHAYSTKLRLTWPLAVLSLIAPLLLMLGHWPASWVSIYCMVFSGAAISALIVIERTRQPTYSLKDGGGFLLGIGFIILLTIICIVAAGTPISTLWQSVIMAPLKHPGVYSYPVPWTSGVIAVSVIGLSTCLLLEGFGNHPWRAPLIASLRIIIGGWFLVQARHVIDSTGLHVFNFEFGPSLAWVMVMPLRAHEISAALRAKAWLLLVFLWQTLQAYPVAGSQMAWGSFLWVPIAIIGLHEAIATLLPYVKSKLARRLCSVTMSLAMLGSAGYAVTSMGKVGLEILSVGEPLGLKGAKNMRLTRYESTALRTIANNARMHAHTLFSFPGMMSFNIWTDLPTPTNANVTHWFSLLNDHQQKAIIERINADPTAAVVVHRRHLQYLFDNNFGPQGVLKDYILSNFEPTLRIDQYDLWVHRGRKIIPIEVVRLTRSGLGDRLRFALPASSQRIGSIQLRWLYPGPNPIIEAQPSPAVPWNLTSMDASGQAAAASKKIDAAFNVTATSWLDMPLPVVKNLPRLADIEAVLLDTEGQIIASFRFNEAPHTFIDTLDLSSGR